MGSRYSIGSVYGMEHGYRIVKVFRIFIRKKRDGKCLLDSMCTWDNKRIWLGGQEMALEK